MVVKELKMARCSGLPCAKLVFRPTLSLIYIQFAKQSGLMFAKSSEAPSFGVQADTPDSPSSQEKIMIVDDESQIAKLYSLILSSAGFTISHLEFDGQEAISRLRKGADIDLVIIDQRMPNMDGLSATRIMKELKPNLKFIMVSAYELPPSEKQIFHAVLTKPVSSRTLVKTVREVLSNN